MDVQEKLVKTAKVGLKMKELVEATRVPKSTILFYLQEGLLPAPVKTSPNMAYYDPSCVETIQYIQLMQQRHRLSLAEIKQLMEARGEEADFTTYVKLERLIFGAARERGGLEFESFLDETGLSEGQATELLDARLLLPLEEGRFDQDDVVAGKMFAQAFSWGIRVEDLAYYVEVGDKLIEEDMALKRRMTQHLPYQEDAAMTLEMVKNARLSRSYIFERLFQHKVASMRDLKDEEG